MPRTQPERLQEHAIAKLAPLRLASFSDLKAKKFEVEELSDGCSVLTSYDLTENSNEIIVIAKVFEPEPRGLHFSLGRRALSEGFAMRTDGSIRELSEREFYQYD